MGHSLDDTFDFSWKWLFSKGSLARGTWLTQPCSIFPSPGRLRCHCTARWRGQSWRWCSVLLGVFGFYPPSLCQYAEGQFWYAGDHYSRWVCAQNLYTPLAITEHFYFVLITVGWWEEWVRMLELWSHLYFYIYFKIKYCSLFIPCLFHKNLNLTRNKWNKVVP